MTPAPHNAPAPLRGLNASRKADRERIADMLTAIAAKHGAAIERRDEPASPGFSGAGIALRFVLNGVGAMVDVDNLHGGDWSLIHWHNDYGADYRRPAGNFSRHFLSAARCSDVTGRPHHKATSHPRSWDELANDLDAGLAMAAAGVAFSI